MVESVTMGNIRDALNYCGYDLNEVMGNKSRKRLYADLRSIVWSIYCKERNVTSGQASRAFGWDRTTIYCSLSRVHGLRLTDRVYSDMYDSIYGAYLAYASKQEDNEKQETNEREESADCVNL